ncbi:MAG: AAA family ATPase [Ferruginibacter sp.]
MFERIHLESLMKRVEVPKKFIQVLMGPRQVGKTTLITQLIEKIKMVTILPLQML